jgi:hypothetical protein
LPLSGLPPVCNSNFFDHFPLHFQSTFVNWP